MAAAIDSMVDNNNSPNSHDGHTSHIQLSPKIDSDEIDFLGFAIVLAKNKKIVLGLPIVTAFLSAAVVLMVPNWYMAQVKILPPQQSQSNAVAILGQLGALTGSAAALGVKNPSEIFVAMLKSRTIADNLIKKFSLMEVYESRIYEEARKELKGNTTIAASRDGVIVLEVEDKNPRRAADLANGYIEELEGLTLNLAVTEAAQRRLFFDKQLKKAKQDLASAELEFQKLQERTGIINPSGQAGLSVSAAAALRAQISSKEVQLSSLRSFATNENPDLVRIEREIEGLRLQLQRTGKASQEKGDVLVGIGKVPGASVEFINKYRDVKYNEALFELLAKQYEIAKIDEAKNATLIQVLDRAVEPERKSGPKRLLIVLLATLAMGFVGILIAFIRESLSRAKGNPLQLERIGLFRRYLMSR